MPALAIPGILRMSGSMDEIRGLEDIMRVAKNAGAKRVILPLSAIAGLQSVSSEIISGPSPVFYMDGDRSTPRRRLWICRECGRAGLRARGPASVLACSGKGGLAMAGERSVGELLDELFGVESVAQASGGA